MYINTLNTNMISILYIIRMAILYRTAKFNTATIAILGPTTKFSSCQYFQLYGRSHQYHNFRDLPASITT